MNRSIRWLVCLAFPGMLAVSNALAQEQDISGATSSQYSLSDDLRSEAAGTYPAANAPAVSSPQANTAGDGITVSLLNPANRLKVTAGLDTLAVFSSKRTFPSGIPLFLLPDSPFGLDTNSFDLHARQSYVAASYSGPEYCGLTPGAQMLLFVQNNDLSADDYGLLVYSAFGELKNERWRFAAGLQPDIFNPMSPTIVYLTKMYGSGNTGSYRGQIRLERMFQDAPDLGVTFQTAVSEPLSTLVTGNAGRIVEDNGWPNVESRIEFGIGPRCPIRGSTIRPLEIGLSGVIGQYRTTRTLLGDPSALPPRAVIDTWGLGADLQWWFNECCGIRGEGYTGRALGEYNGGVLQSFNPVTFEEVRSSGGFIEGFRYLSEKFHVHIGYGYDDPDDDDLTVTQIRSNQTYFANFVYDWSKSVQLGLEIDYRKTDYTQFLPNAFLDSDAVVVATRYLWRF